MKIMNVIKKKESGLYYSNGNIIPVFSIGPASLQSSLWLLILKMVLKRMDIFQNKFLETYCFQATFLKCFILKCA